MKHQITHIAFRWSYRILDAIRCHWRWLGCWLYWHLYTEQKCAWCGKTLRPARITAEVTSHGICIRCAAKWRAGQTDFRNQ